MQGGPFDFAKTFLHSQMTAHLKGKLGDRNAQQKPQRCKTDADLPHQIQRLGGVIPDVPTKFEVDDAASDKLQPGDEQGIDGAAEPNRQPAKALHRYLSYQHKANSAQHKHAPVGESAPEHLQKRIADRPKQKNDGVIRALF